MPKLTKFKELAPGQKFTVGPAHRYRKAGGPQSIDLCPICQHDVRNATRLDVGFFGYTHFCPNDSVVAADDSADAAASESTTKISDDLTVTMDGPSVHQRYATITSKNGKKYGDAGFVCIPVEEIPVLIRALIATQTCLVCALGEIAEGYLHDEDCPEYSLS